jgi:hypothetical protein
LRPECRTKIIIALVVLCLQIGLVRTQFTYAQEPALQPGRGAVPPAKRGGYILVGPMGFNVRGRYGIPMGPMGPGRGIPPKTANSTTPPAQPDANPAPKPKTSLFFDPNDPPNLRELRERDVMNVLDMVRKEFNVDECRIYRWGIPWAEPERDISE